MDYYDIMYNEKSENYSLWLNGKIIKIAKRKTTLLKELNKRGGTLEE